MYPNQWQPSAKSSKNGPKSFIDCFEKINSGISLQTMGFSQDTTDGLVRRFCYRWRFANSFEGLNLIDYHESTVLGYSGLAKVFFSFSVLERFVKFIGEEWHSCVNLLPSNEIDSLYTLFQDADKNSGLSMFLRERVNNRLEQRLISLKGGNKLEIIAIAAAIRHIFAHGHLTAHPGGVDSTLMCKLNFELSKVMLDFMDREFSKKVDSITLK